MDLAEIVGFVTGAVCVWLAVRQNVWTFPVGLANNAAFGVLFAGAGLYANAALQVLFAVVGALGWYWWTRRGPDGAGLVVRRTPRWAWGAAAGATAVLTAAGVVALAAWTDSGVPFWDSLTTATSVVAQVMLGRKWLGNWFVWAATDVVLIGLYASQGLWLTAVLYLGYLGLCVAGVRRWRRALRDAGAHGPAATRPGAASADPEPAAHR
ncbi:nicotinamide riboside transporter PnuC [Occultella glacieicola]|uniref:Nicotinamide riboside transporter PnuC n=1 Tax=Occultella glacieicola TaxID=2518684 RepID=A0ABY2DXN9_9MICO|nr:nicotinamide riboside transporter PnuC [Occultella glacieicola]TDE88885.1 nicotinamide riboside transporter PnuC [Occultella glacieicola]